MRNHTPEERYKITLRVNRDLLEEIRRLAQSDNRTINNYVTNLIRREMATFIRQTEGKKK